jgi:PAS domain S-box-containing protein
MPLFKRLRHDRSLEAKGAALEALRTNVMIADEALTIRYMNPTLVTLMREAEQELKRELPGFSAASLIGSNIDIFHKNPSYQRKMLAAMEKTHAASITVGSRVFDLVITPIFEGGRRTGFVVEWADARARLQNVDYASKMHAISRTQSVIEFTTEGIILDANERFLKTMGYTLEEIRGKHHSMFVDPAERNTPEYAEFWRSLKAGQFQAGQFKRVGKSGRTVWIEGAYNPILDAQNRVTKIVKFASDVTAQVNLLGDLKRLIDQNFGEIDNALARSESEGGSAAEAAEETSRRVQTVATGTEQMAASISEISGNMIKTQAAANQAFDRAVAVGESTSKLAAATREMNGIVDLISSVASQINLLALNATIEAARAGDAGKGFAVVASEVKNLANQSATATARISREIEGIQATSTEVARATETICDAIKDVREYVTTSAASVEEQNSVTANIAGDMQSAASTLQRTSQSIAGISSAMSQVSQTVAKTKDAAMVLVK